MAFELFKLFGSIMVDNDKANESISKTEQKAEGLGNKLAGGIKTAGAWGLAIGAAAGAAGGALLGVATKASETTDRIDKMSQKLGMSKEGFQEWDYILGQNGISIDGLQGGIKTLTNMTDELSKGSKTATDSFGRLGLSFDDLKGKSQEEIFNLTIDKLMQVEDETQRAALANDLLGRSGAELAPLLNQGAEGAEELRKRAHELGLVLSDDAVNAGVVFGDTMDDLKKSFGNVVTQIGVELMPMFQNLMDWVLAHMPEIREFASNAFKVIGDAVMIVWGIFENYLLPVMESIYGWVKDNWPTISAIIKTAFQVIETVWNNVLSPVLGFLWDALKKVVDFVSDNFPGFQSTVENVMSGVKSAVGFVVDIFDGLASSIGWALDKWNDWRNRPEDKKTGGNFSGGASAYATKPMIDGRHADGLDYVPKNGYIAELHKGERVLTKKENDNYSSGVNITGNTFNIREEADIKKVAQELFELQRMKNRGRGLATT